MVEFIDALSVDFDHLRNVGYSVVSIASSYSPMLMGLLLLDVLNKNKSLQKVMDLFKSNVNTMVATIILNFIFLYIFTFVSFTLFREDFRGAEGEGEYKMFAENLLSTFLTTVQAGLRSGGGVGSSLYQRDRDE